MSISLLTFVPFSLPDESPVSVVCRAAKENGFKNASRLLNYLQASTKKPLYGNYLLNNSPLSQVLQSCAPEWADRIQDNFYTPAHPLMKQSDVLIKGVEIWHTNLRGHATALCTECLKEGYEKFPRDIKLFSTCPFHNCALLSICPSCGNALKWKNHPSDTCECGNQLVSPCVSASQMHNDHYLLQLFEQNDTESMAAIQRIITKLKRETFSTLDTVRSAQYSLAIAVTSQDFDLMAAAIHNCLPTSSAEEIDLSLSLLKNELSNNTGAELRKQLLASASEHRTPAASVTLRAGTLRKYLGIPEKTWYGPNQRRPQGLFNGNGRAAEVSLEEAIELKKAVVTERALEAQFCGEIVRNSKLSIKEVNRLTDIPENAIESMALDTTLLGPIRRNSLRKKQGAELLFEKSNIDSFNQRYVCSHRLSREWNIPIIDIEQAILTHKLEPQKCNPFDGVKIILRSRLCRLSNILNITSTSKTPKHLEVPKLSETETGPYITNQECANLLKISKGTVKFLIKEGFILCHRKSRNGQYLTTEAEALKFRENHLSISDLSKILNMPDKVVSNKLANAGIMPSCGPLVGSGKIHFYARISIPAMILIALKHNKNSTVPRPSTGADTDHSEYCVSTKSLCDQYSMAEYSFYRYFVANDFVKSVKRRVGRYVTLQDSKKIHRIMKTYVTREQAADMLGLSSDYFRAWIKRHHFVFDDTQFQPRKNMGLISRIQMKELRTMFTSRL